MTVVVLNHLHDPAVELNGVDEQKLIIQTGTLVFDFRGSVDGGWIRERFAYPVLELPPGTEHPAFGPRIRAIASAAPSSMSYSPPPALGNPNRGSGLWAQGTAVLNGFSNDGFVQVAGPVALPVTGMGPASAPGPTFGAGWAVDRTQATHDHNRIQLVVDLAVSGPSSLLRLAYSVFVTISPRVVVEEIEK